MSGPFSLFSAESFIPHGFCLSWDPPLVALDVVSDSLIAASYYSIPLALIAFVLRRKDVAFSAVFWAFAAFILACGTTHVFDVLTLWRPLYWSQGSVKAMTAAVSVVTAIGLWPLLPKALALPSPTELQRANQELAAQIEARDAAVDALRRETEQRERTEAMLRQAQKMEAMGQLTGGIAHDFNNLLMVVQGNLEALEARLGEGDPNRRYVERALSGTERGALLVYQLLSFARQQPLEAMVFDPGARLLHLRDMLRASLGDEITVNTCLAPDLWPVHVDPNQFDAAILNLAVNARDAMPRGGTVTLEASNVASSGAERLLGGGYVRIAVRDTGTGMKPEIQQAAFDPFFTTKPIGKGSGLGLSQVYGFARQSGGHVMLESAPGEGTVVTIMLPRAEAEQG